MNEFLNLGWIGQGLRSIRRSSGRADADRAQAAVRRVMRDLQNLNRSTERDFLAVGGKLMEFRSSAREIAEAMAAAAELVSGEQGRNASRALARMLDHSRRVDASVGQSGLALGAVQDLSIRLRNAFSGLSNLVSIFRSLCTLTQIETARLGGAGADLGHLAAEIRPLSEHIQSSGEGVLDASHRLEDEVRSAMRSGAQLRDTQLKELHALADSAVDSLRALEERRRLAAESSDRQAAEYTALGAAIDDLVASIQFHDITRQQVEHVIEALGRLSADGNGRGAASPLNSGALFALQASQLAEAARLFAASIERIESDLESIAARLEGSAQAVRGLMGISFSDHASFFQKMEAQFGTILEILAASTAAHQKTAATAAGLEQTIGRMRSSVTEIRGTEIQIQRISTNATIRSIHIGAPGVALNKIAEVMQRLALESNSNTDGAAATLEEMSRAAQGIAGSEGEFSEADELAAEMRRALTALHSSSETGFERAQHVATLSANLAREIGTLRAGISAGREFAAATARARGELELLGAKEGEPGALDSAAREHLELAARTYTMQRQRDVHASVLGEAPLAGNASASPKPSSGSDSFGDNVELF